MSGYNTGHGDLRSERKRKLLMGNLHDMTIGDRVGDRRTGAPPAAETSGNYSFVLL